MFRLIASEARKLVTTRSTWGIVGGMVLVLLAGALQTAGHAGEVGKTLVERQFWFLGTFNGRMFLAVLGIKFVTDEFRYQTIVPTLLINPRRMQVVTAKVVVAAVAGLVASALSVAVMVAAASPHLDRSLAVAEWRSVATFVLAGALWTAVAAGIAFVVRHQTGAIVGAIAWVLILEQIVGAGSDRVARVLPGGGFGALAIGQTAKVLFVGGAILGAYALAAGVAGAITMTRRDVV